VLFSIANDAAAAMPDLLMFFPVETLSSIRDCFTFVVCRLRSMVGKSPLNEALAARVWDDGLKGGGFKIAWCGYRFATEGLEYLK